MEIVEYGRKSKEELYHIKNELIVEKMKLDKFFSIFLSANGLDENHTDTNEWKEYKTELNKYQDISNRINWVDYYLKRT